MRVYLDADLSPRIAALARDVFGLDVVSCHELGTRRAGDDTHLARATADGRCLVTNNRNDFLMWDRRYRQHGLRHAGILLTTDTLPVHDFYLVAKALAYYHHTLHPHPFTPGLVDWLHEAPATWEPPPGRDARYGRR